MKQHVFIAVTAGDGKVHAACAESILKNVEILRDSGIAVTTYFHAGDCYISRARDLCCALMMKTPKYTDLLFIDSDLAFDDDAMLKILKHDADIIAGAYPYRTKVINNFPVSINADLDFTPMGNPENGLISARTVPTGFMRIRRNVFLALKQKYGDKFLDRNKLDHWFDAGMCFAPDDMTWYGEDTAFCKRWTAIGGQIWIEPRITFRHIGNEGFVGNYDTYLRDRKNIKPGNEFEEMMKEVDAINKAAA
jgi:hypothetical protein